MLSYILPAHYFRLKKCQGDCDGDSDCYSDDLVCWFRDSNEKVPGCRGGENYDEKHDFCVPRAKLPTAPPTSPYSLQFLCDDDCRSR